MEFPRMKNMNYNNQKNKLAHNAKDHTSERFGMLVAVERIQGYRGNETFYRCLCDCGAEKIVSSGNLMSGHTRSCGGRNHKKRLLIIRL